MVDLKGETNITWASQCMDAGTYSASTDGKHALLSTLIMVSVIESYRVLTGHVHIHFLCANLYVIELSEGCFSSNCAHIPLMIHAGTTNSNLGHHSWPHRLGSIWHSRCWLIWPNFVHVFNKGANWLQQTLSSISLYQITISISISIYVISVVK